MTKDAILEKMKIFWAVAWLFIQKSGAGIAHFLQKMAAHMLRLCDPDDFANLPKISGTLEAYDKVKFAPDGIFHVSRISQPSRLVATITGRRPTPRNWEYKIFLFGITFVLLALFLEPIFQFFVLFFIGEINRAIMDLVGLLAFVAFFYVFTHVFRYLNTLKIDPKTIVSKLAFTPEKLTVLINARGLIHLREAHEIELNRVTRISLDNREEWQPLTSGEREMYNPYKVYQLTLWVDDLLPIPIHQNYQSYHDNRMAQIYLSTILRDAQSGTAFEDGYRPHPVQSLFAD